MERHFLGVEFWSTILVTAGLVVWGYRYGGRHVTDELLQGDRSTIYSTFASVYASLFGFLIAAVAFVIGLANKEARLALLRNSPHYKTLRKAFMSAIWWLGFATLVSLVSFCSLSAVNIPIFGSFVS